MIAVKLRQRGQVLHVGNFTSWKVGLQGGFLNLIDFMPASVPSSNNSSLLGRKDRQKTLNYLDGHSHTVNTPSTKQIRVCACGVAPRYDPDEPSKDLALQPTAPEFLDEADTGNEPTDRRYSPSILTSFLRRQRALPRGTMVIWCSPSQWHRHFHLHEVMQH